MVQEKKQKTKQNKKKTNKQTKKNSNRMNWGSQIENSGNNNKRQPYNKPDVPLPQLELPDSYFQSQIP